MITTNDGHFNGFTDKDTTTFIYDINKKKFLESLDVFLNFFIKPLFKREYIDKELFAVNSEFEKNIHSEEKRFKRLFQSLTNLNHPFSKFSTGNKETLKGHHIKLSKLREEVIDYFLNYYTGKNIKIVVYTNFEIETVKSILKRNMIMAQNFTSSNNFLFNTDEKKYNNDPQKSNNAEIFTIEEKVNFLLINS